MSNSLKFWKKVKSKMTFIFSASIDNFNNVTRCFNSVTDENSMKTFCELTTMLFSIDMLKIFFKCVMCFCFVLKKIIMSSIYVLKKDLYNRNTL